jgi:hypothetical protein
MIGPGFAAAALAPFYCRAVAVIVMIVLAAFGLGYWIG